MCRDKIIIETEKYYYTEVIPLLTIIPTISPDYMYIPVKFEVKNLVSLPGPIK